MTPAQELEIEVKVRLAAPEGWPARLEALGLRAVQPPQPELSTLWDRDGALLAAGCALRTRRCGIVAERCARDAPAARSLRAGGRLGGLRRSRVRLLHGLLARATADRERTRSQPHPN